jgi:hypothetical protein
MDNYDAALATWDDDGGGCAITSEPNAHVHGKHCGPGYHPDAVTVQLIEQYESTHRVTSFRVA